LKQISWFCHYLLPIGVLSSAAYLGALLYHDPNAVCGVWNLNLSALVSGMSPLNQSPLEREESLLHWMFVSFAVILNLVT
jgi:hypothetical protein